MKLKIRMKTVINLLLALFAGVLVCLCFLSVKEGMS